jgi:hypothetical protein
MPDERHFTLTPSGHGLPEGWSPELFRVELEQAAATFSHPAVPCASLQVSVAPPAPRWLAAEDGVNLVAFRSQTWCHNGRCGHLDTFPLSAMAMTETHPSSARGAEIREGDIELNAVRFRFVATQAKAAPDELVIPLRAVLLHEVGHIVGLPDRCVREGSHGSHAAVPERGACGPGEAESVMFAPALNLALSELDVAALCAQHPRAGTAGLASGGDAGSRASLDLSLPAGFAVALLAALAGMRLVRHRLRTGRTARRTIALRSTR